MYIVIFGLSILSRIESIEFMGIDASSIVSSLRELTTAPYYNMNNSYHSQFYGWTYFSLNICCVADSFNGLWIPSKIEHNIMKIKNKKLSE